MPGSPRAQDGSESQTLEAHRNAICDSLHVAIPGIIQSFDPEAVTCIVQPAIVSPQSQAQKIANISTAAQLRTDDGAAFVEVASDMTLP